ncbi:hypothetical protein SynA1825c_02924 [Synechococcus sp. A18-25c]|nr:hypothetical protein SynA1825c_02924 [Synechococcus sp. A18-25c]
MFLNMKTLIVFGLLVIWLLLVLAAGRADRVRRRALLQQSR